MIVPCDYRGPLRRSVDCGCGGPRQTYLCHNAALAQRECVLTPLMPKAVKMFGQIQACGECDKRVWRGEPCPPEKRTEGAVEVTGESFPASLRVKDVTTPVPGLDPSICRHNGKNRLAWREDARGIVYASVDHALKIDDPRSVYVPPIREAMDGKRAVKLHSLSKGMLLSFTGIYGAKEACVLVSLTDAGEPFGQVPVYYPQGNGLDGDWTLFEDNGLCAVTQLNPLTVVRIDDGTARLVSRERWDCSWRWGEMRCGTPPVSREGLFVTWFNSGGYIGALEFQAGRVTACTSRPMIAEMDGTAIGGAFYNLGCWTLSLETRGRVRFVQFLDADLKRELVPV